MEKQITAKEAWEIVKDDLFQTIEKTKKENSDKNLPNALGVDVPSVEHQDKLSEEIMDCPTKSGSIKICLSHADNLATAIINVYVYAGAATQNILERQEMVKRIEKALKK